MSRVGRYRDAFLVNRAQRGVEVLDAVDPFVLLLRRGGGDSVDHVIALYHSPVGFRLTRLNELPSVIGDVQLEAVLHGRQKNNRGEKTINTRLLGDWKIRYRLGIE